VAGSVKATPGLLPRPGFYTTTWDTSGKIVGLLYVGFQPNRFRVPPGAYSVRVANLSAVQLVGDDGKTANPEVAARIQAIATIFSTPVASFDDSVCYKFDRAIICI
jgi:hypothetical protein